VKNSSAAPQISIKKPALLINRNFALLWSGQIISIVGDFVFDTILVLWIATLIAQGKSWAPLAVSGILLSASLPVFVIGPLAGVFVDRWNKRRTMLCMDALRAILILLLLLPTGILPLPFLVASRLPIFWQLGFIYGTVFLTSTCTQFFGPSLFALIGDIVDEPYRARATGLTQLIVSLGTIIGPSLATLLFFKVGVQSALLLNALSFMVSFLAILALRPPQTVVSGERERQGTFLHEFGQGIRFYAGNRVLMTMLISVTLVMAGAGALNALGIFFVTHNLHTPVSFFGFLSSVLGAGSIVGAALASAWAQRLGLTRTFWLSLVAAGVLVLIYARLTSLVPALVVLFLIGLVTTAVDVAAGPLVLNVTPRELVGRVAALLNPALTLVTMLSIAVAGYLYSTVLQNFHATLVGITFGPIDTIFTVTGILVVAGGLYAMVNLRGVTLSTESEPSSEALKEEVPQIVTPN
jgi:MFS family permease